MKKLQPSRILPLKKLSRFSRKEGQTICFKHRVLQKLCHCTSNNTLFVSSRCRIPGKDDVKGWKQLYDYFFPKVAYRWKTEPDGKRVCYLRPLPRPALPKLTV